MSKINLQNSLKDLISKYDSNRNGKLDDSEKDIMRTSIFSVADENQDGVISNEEGEKYVNKTGLKVAVSEFISFIKDSLNTKVTEREDGTKLIETLDSDGKVSKAVKKDADGNIIWNSNYEYDSEGKIVRKTYRYNDGGITAEEYDANENLVYATSTFDDRSTMEERYNSNGDKIHNVLKDLNGNIIDEYFMDYEYDSSSKKIKMIYKDSQKIISTTDYKYTKDGKLSRMICKYDDFIEETTYDSDEREICKVSKTLDGKIITEEESEYNSNNIVKTTKYPSGDIEQEVRDNNYKLIKITKTISGVSTEYEYDENLNIANKTTKNEKGEIVSKCSYIYDSDRNCTSYQGFSQVSNNNYKGDKYIINKNGDKITITNESTNETRAIYLRDILVAFPPEERSGMQETLYVLPGEVLFELSAESDYLEYPTEEELMNVWRANGGNPETGTAGGYYSTETDLIYVKNNDRSGETLTHELGHAVDNVLGNYALSADEKFFECYIKGMKRYLADGHKAFSYKSKEKEPGTYCTANQIELWAEIYALLMLGFCNSKETLEKYFPEAIEYAAKTLLPRVRTMNQSERHARYAK